MSEPDNFLLRTVNHSVGVAFTLGKAELHRRGGGGVAGFAIEGKIARRDLQAFVAWLAGGGRSASEFNLHVTLANNISSGGLVVAFARVNVVVATAVVAVDGDPNVLEQGAILV